MFIFNKSPMLWRNLLSQRVVSNYFRHNFYSTSYDFKLTLKGVPLSNYIKQLESEHSGLYNNFSSKKRIDELQPIINILNERKLIVDNIKSLGDLLKENDAELKKLAEEERDNFENKINVLDQDLLESLLPNFTEDLRNSLVLEVNTGVGGQEAMLFANELFDMYCNFAAYKGWQVEIADYSSTDLGGIRHGSALISGNRAFRYFKHEAGVHRVQRIPSTEKAGRTHTSTVSVLALPQPTEIEIQIEHKDLRIETKRASGAGGQHVNTTDSAVRITHIPTGLSVECQVDRSQLKNRQIALVKLRTLLYEQQLQGQIAENLAARKSQVRSNYRNEKIRTYNFPQDRITDHRLKSSNVHNIKGFLEGNDALEDLIEKLDSEYRIDALLEIVNISENKK